MPHGSSEQTRFPPAMKVPNSPDELMRLIDSHNDEKNQCDCDVCSTVRLVIERDLTLREVLVVIYVLTKTAMNFVGNEILNCDEHRQPKSLAAWTQVYGGLDACGRTMEAPLDTVIHIEEILDSIGDKDD